MVRITAKLLALCTLALFDMSHASASSSAFVSPISLTQRTQSFFSAYAPHPLWRTSQGGGRRGVGGNLNSSFRALASAAGEMPVRLRRSVLCVPPRLEKAVSVAKTCDADTLIFDLEDAVAPIHKADARFRPHSPSTPAMRCVVIALCLVAQNSPCAWCNQGHADQHGPGGRIWRERSGDPVQRPGLLRCRPAIAV